MILWWDYDDTMDMLYYFIYLHMYTHGYAQMFNLCTGSFNRSKSSHVIPNGRNCSMGWISQTFTTPYTPRRKHEANRKMHTLLSCGLSCIPMGSSSNLDVYFILFNQCGGQSPNASPMATRAIALISPIPPKKISIASGRSPDCLHWLLTPDRGSQTKILHFGSLKLVLVHYCSEDPFFLFNLNFLCSA
jgi:hypothetical protein